MFPTVEIGTLITCNPGIHGGCPIIAGTGVTVRRIASDYNAGMSAEDIVAELPHLNLAQVFAALTYYHANKAQIDGDIAEQDAVAKRLEAEDLAQSTN